MNLGLAFKTFFRILGDGAFADQVQQIDAAPAPTSSEVEPKIRRSPALTLLATLQREARLVDFLKENLDGYSDDQVGAAVRDIHRDGAAALERMFGLETLRGEGEDSPISVPVGFDPARLRLTGNVTGEPPHQGVLRHAGWKATRCELPEWTGGENAVLTVAPAEVELP